MGLFTSIRKAMSDPFKMVAAYQAVETIADLAQKRKNGQINFSDLTILGGSEILAEVLPEFGVTVVDDLGLRDDDTLQGSMAIAARKLVNRKLSKAKAEAEAERDSADDDDDDD